MVGDLFWRFACTPSAEIIEHVGEYVCLTAEGRAELESRVEQNHPICDGLLNLRLTCRSLDAKIQRLVTRTYFVDRTFFVFDLWSLKALEGISEHHIFAKSLKKIRLNLNLLRVNQADEGDGELGGMQFKQSGKMYVLGHTGTSSLSTKRYTRRYLRLQHRQTKLRGGELVLQHSRRVLKKLQETRDHPDAVYGGLQQLPIKLVDCNLWICSTASILGESSEAPHVK